MGSRFLERDSPDEYFKRISLALCMLGLDISHQTKENAYSAGNDIKYIHHRKQQPTSIAWHGGFLGQIEEGGCGHHVVEDGADTGRVSHHDDPQQVEKDHVAMSIL